jgi:diguanylate cyclase (GGDEF)-like protein
MMSQKKSIMLVLLLLVALFIGGMWVMSRLNLDYSQRAMAALRQLQIEEVFSASLQRIDAHHQLLQQHVEALARLAELVQHLNPAALEQQLGRALRQQVRDFPEAFGAGIWLESGAGAPLGLYVHWNNDEGIETIRHASGRAYRDQDWHQVAPPPAWQSGQTGARQHHWTPAYYNPLPQAAVITLASPVLGKQGQITGLATTDWRTDEVIGLISQIRVTPGSFAFLVDSSNHNLSSLTQLEDSDAAQSIMQAILDQDLMQAGSASRRLEQPLRSPMRSQNLQVDGVDYALFHAQTRAGMLFGIGVPQAEIDAVLQPMRTSNYRILVIAALVMLLLSALILYFVAGIMRQLQASYTDELTHLPNRAKLLQDLQKQASGSLILLNLDAFKEINGFFGHACGDFVLRSLAQQLQQWLASAVWPDRPQLYRLSADEFAVHFGSALQHQQLEDCVQQLSLFIQSRRLLWQGQEIGLNATLGAARREDLAGDDDLLAIAGNTLKLARQLQQNHLLHDPAIRLRETFERNLLMAKQLKLALQQDRILPWFQPIFDNRSGQTDKFECLVRMLGEDGQVLSPGLFLDVAKKTRLQRQITRVMLEKCCALFAELPWEFSINLSTDDLLDPQLADFITRQVERNGVGRRLIFEIVESEGIENYAQARLFIDRMKQLGCRIAIDDFGTGYSNFEHLLRLNVDLIKIDGSLIRQLDSDPAAFRVSQGIVSFARSLGILTVAEFVHSPQIQEQVLQLGIDFSQGAHFGMPQPAPDAGRLQDA